VTEILERAATYLFEVTTMTTVTTIYACSREAR
jgi:hypothetical protein